MGVLSLLRKRTWKKTFEVTHQHFIMEQSIKAEKEESKGNKH